LDAIRKGALQNALRIRVSRWKQTMLNLQIRMTKAINRRRRKKETLYIYMEFITERLKHLYTKFGIEALKKYGGSQILSAIESPKRKKIIYDYIYKTEREYINAMVKYKRSLAANKDPTERVWSKFLEYFTKKQLLERSYEVEIDILERNIN
jgi:secreted Zn-dependent insulinase-like peptidase